MFTKLTDAERIAEIAKRLLAEHRKYAKIQDRGRDMQPGNGRAQKLANDLNYQAHAIVRIETELHAAMVDAGLADLREPEEYAERDWKPTAFHHYRWQPAIPAAHKARVSDA